MKSSHTKTLKGNNLRTLIFDIEVSPNIAYVWGKWETNVLKYTREGYMLCFAYKWLEDKKVSAYSLPDFKLYKTQKHNDKELVKKLWKLFDEADVIIAHNGKSFDIKKSNAYFIKVGLTPPSPYTVVDTLLATRSSFKFNSNKLDDIGDYLHIGRKKETGGFELWENCMAGDKKAWKKMVEYNKQDVVLLESVYRRILPWIKNHPHTKNKGECTQCGSINFIKRGFNLAGKQKLLCKSCGGWLSAPIGCV